jgi:threonine/homoserine/homoserine lactone efflux protein
MVSSQNFVAFFIASAIIILVPGPSVLFTVARGIAWGRATAVLTTLGNTLGTYLLAVLVAVGLGPLIAHSAIAATMLQLAGGTYLVYLGIDAYRHRRAHANAMVSNVGARPNVLATIRQGFVVGVLNPKSLIFFTAVFPHFVDRSRGHVTVQLLVYGTVFSGMAFISDGTWGFIAGTAREWLSADPKRLVAMRVVGAGVMTTLGLLVAGSALGL